MATQHRPEDTDSRGIIEQVESDFPFDGFREYQQEILHEAARALYENPDINTVVIDAPTGIGKSAINMTIGKQAKGGAFYTTPQKKLRNQLQDDDDLLDMHAALRSRRDYSCDSVPSRLADENRSYDCDSCPVNVRGDVSCREMGCAYWQAKESAMKAQIATLTFAFLIVDNRVPTYSLLESGEAQISFDDREVGIIDEAHTLAEQCASLHAGSTLSSYSLGTREIAAYDISAQSPDDVSEAVRSEDVNPYRVFNDEMKRVLSEKEPWVEVDDLDIMDLKPVIEETVDAINKKLELLTAIKLSESGGDVESQLESLSWRLEMVLEDIDEGRPWVLTGGESDTDEFEVSLYPVYVDRFLENNVWNRVDQLVLSTATLPFRNNPKKWVSRIGRDPEKTKVISKPMPFPAENRQVRADFQIGSMSSDGVDEHWDEIIERLREISRRHPSEKGLVHTVSYDRAERLHNALPELTMYHDPKKDLTSAGWINKWQQSDKQMFLSPSMTEGVDLHGDLCRFQVLVKVPYRNISDPRVNYLINEENDWDWYHDVAAREIIQSIGRAVRSPEDYATYYVLDSKFDQVMKNRTPEWLEEAIIR